MNEVRGYKSFEKASGMAIMRVREGPEDQARRSHNNTPAAGTGIGCG